MEPLLGIQLVALGGFLLVLAARRGLFGRRLQEQGIALRRRVRGAEHHSTLIAKSEFADTLTVQQNYVAAVEVRREVLNAQRRALGDRHPVTLRAISQLADTLTEQGNYGAALEARRYVLAVYRGGRGEVHRDTLNAMSELADTLRAQGAPTDIACSSCGSPVWPGCMISDASDVSCPECAAQRTFATRIREIVSVMPVTYGLIAINVLVFLSEGSSAFTISGDSSGSVVANGALLGSGQPGQMAGRGVAHGEPWRLVTSGFLHANLLHIASNMLVLFVLGRVLEPAIGRLKFGVIYAVSLLSGSLGALLVSPHALTIGASGAIFGVMGAAAVELRSRKISLLESGIAPMIILNLAVSFTVADISWGGHVGGLIGGALAASALMLGDRYRAQALAMVGCTVTGAGFVGGALASATSSEHERLTTGQVVYAKKISCPESGPACSVSIVAQVQTSTSAGGDRIIEVNHSKSTLPAGKSSEVGMTLDQHTIGILRATGMVKIRVYVTTQAGSNTPHTIVDTVNLREPVR